MTATFASVVPTIDGVVLVFDGDKQVAAVSSCRKPRWTGPAALVCSSESVGLDGRIKLRAKKVLVGR